MIPLFTDMSFSSLVLLKVRGMDYLLIQKDATPSHVSEGSVFQLHAHTLCTWFMCGVFRHTADACQILQVSDLNLNSSCNSGVVVAL